MGHLVLARRSGLPVVRVDLHALGGRTLYRDDGATPWSRAVIAWGGVLVQAAILVPAILLVELVPLPRGFMGQLLGQVLFILLPINLFILLFNLLPVRGLDGHEAWKIVRMLPLGLRIWWAGRRAQRAQARRDTAARSSVARTRAKARGLRVVDRRDELH
jgi:Zn-dependent protease